MEKFAIIGVSCLFPGAHTPEEFWAQLMAARDCRTDGSRQIYADSPLHGASDANASDHRIYCTRGGFVEGFSFDAQGYRLPPEYLARLDAVFQWSLHTARQALRDSGYGPDARHVRTGVVMGNYAFPTPSSNRMYLPLWYSTIQEGLARVGIDAGPLLKARADLEASRGVPMEHAFVAGMPACMVGAALGLGGPRYALDAACSSALYSVKLACDHLSRGDADIMLAGGVCATDPLIMHLSFADLSAYPKNGFSQPFDRRSAGILTGQGAGFFVIKRLADAQRDGDHQYAVIDGIALCNDGAGRHLLTPNPRGQVDTYERAYSAAATDPREVAYIECHATGTPLGDSTEVAALETFFQKHNAHPRLGSVKGNIGHLLTVAGFSSMLKVILAMRHRSIPPTIGVEEPLSSPGGWIDATSVVREACPWPAAPKAAVSAFGFGGTNAHLILSPPAAAGSDSPPDPQVRAAQPLAIVGMGCHLGSYADLGSFSQAVFTGESTTGRALPSTRWRGMDDVPAIRSSFGLGAGELEGAHIESFDFDPVASKTPPAELEHFNTQHLLMLKVAAEALADAGLPPRANGRTRRIGVLIAMEMEPCIHGHRARFELGAMLREQLVRAGQALSSEQEEALICIARDSIHDRIQPNEVLSYIGNVMASRISSRWDFVGPSFTISSDRNAAVRALDVASLLLMDPELEAVVVGAVDLAAGPESFLCAAGVEGAAVRMGDGAAALVVTRPEALAHWRKHYAMVDAIACRDTAIERASVFASAQEDEIASTIAGALHAAGCGPLDIDLLESDVLAGGAGAGGHVRALARALATDTEQTALLTSVQRTVGCSRSASTLAQVIKAATCLYEAHYAPTPNLTSGETELLAQAVPPVLAVLEESAPWLRKDRARPRRALVDGLGETGSYACLVLSREPRSMALETAHWSQPGLPRLSLLSAGDFSTLLTRLEELRVALHGAERMQPLEPSSGPVRVALVAASAPALLCEVEQALQDLPRVHENGATWATPAGSYYTARPIGPDGKVAFVYPGGFTTYPGLGRELFKLFPGLINAFESHTPRPEEAFRHVDLYPRVRAPSDRRQRITQEARLLDDVPLMLATGTSFAILYTDVLRCILSLKPEVAFGYSLGESSMMFALRGWDPGSRNDRKIKHTPLFRDRLCAERRLVRERWGIEPDVPNGKVWSSHVLLAEYERVEREVARHERVYLTHVNSPKEVVIAGDPEQCKAVIAALACDAARSPAALVMHCVMVESEREELAYLNHTPTRPVEDVALYSAFDYERIAAFDTDQVAQRIAHTLVRPVDFRRLIELSHARGCRYFIEAGPGQTCTRWVQETLSGKPHLALPVERRGQSPAASLLRLVAQLFCNGARMDLSSLECNEAAAEPASHLVRLRCGGTPIPTFIADQAGAYLAQSPVPVAPHTQVPTSARAAPPALRRAAGVAADRARERPHCRVAPVHGAPVYAVHEALPVAASARVAVGASHAGTQDVPAPASFDAGVAQGRRLIAGIVQQTVYAHGTLLDWQYARQARAVGRLRSSLEPAIVSLRAFPAPVQLREPAPMVPELLPVAPAANVIWDERALLEFATGSIGRAFGESYAAIDGYGKRVRLPAPPYLFVSRVTKLSAESGKLKPSSITTEFDVPRGAWFSLDGQVPPAITIEAGQCDLLLISYLGVDFQNRGERVYRLLDSTLTFKGDLPHEGQTLRYDIRITRFVRNGSQLLFFFAYECYADERLILVLEDACAGFFSPLELAQPLGVVFTEREKRERAEAQPGWFKPLCRTEKTALSRADIEQLTRGEISTVFGPEYDQEGGNPSLRLPATDLLMIDEVQRIDRKAGPWGLGCIEASKALAPDGWYFTCHFSDDPVLAGSMVGEGAVQLLQVYALYLGLQMSLPDARFEPIQGLKTSVRVRGQITLECEQIKYLVEIRELELLPRPHMVADVTVSIGDKPVIFIRQLGLCVKEKPGTAFRPGEQGKVGSFLGRRNHQGERAMLSEFHMAHAAKGDLAVAMGPEFEVYEKRRAPYIPNGRFLFVDRVMDLRGERGVLKPGAVMVTEYDSWADAWYYRHSGYPAMPNFVLLESSLQAAILLGYYLGATLLYPDTEFSIRNLEGTATWLREVDLRDRTIRQSSKLLSTNTISGSLLQNFSYELAVDGEPFYVGESLFGYFDGKALANQVGLDGRKLVPPWYRTCTPEQRQGERRVDLRALETGERTGLSLPTGPLRALDYVDIVPAGGKHGRGYAFGYREVCANDWYFLCHFHRDPVMPGSLGIEALLQAIQAYVLDQGLAQELARPRFALAANVPVFWKYRGQILKPSASDSAGRENRHMWVEAHVKKVRKEDGRVTVICDGSLWKDSLRIYEASGLAISALGSP